MNAKSITGICPTRHMNLEYARARLTSGMSPAAERGGQDTPASILAVIYGEEPHILMTKKPKDLRVHAGEISFPGGKREEADADMLDTALRETREEIGLDVPRRSVVGQLEPVTTLSTGFRITPFVAVVDDVSGMHANTEVERIFEIPLEPLLRTMSDDPDPGHRFARDMFVFTFDGGTVWGASARVLNQMATRLGITPGRG